MTLEDMAGVVEILDRVSDLLSGERFRMLLAIRECLLGMEEKGWLPQMPGDALRRKSRACAEALLKDDALAPLREMRGLLFALGSGTPGGDSAGSRESQTLARYLSDVLKAFREGKQWLGRMQGIGAEDREAEQMEWAAEERLLQEKLSRVLTVYELAGYREIHERTRRELEGIRELAQGADGMDDMLEELARLEEGKRLFEERAEEWKKRWARRETIPQGPGYMEYREKSPRKEEKHAESNRPEEQESIPHPENAD